MRESYTENFKLFSIGHETVLVVSTDFKPSVTRFINLISVSVY